jgi:hypothetical protein
MQTITTIGLDIAKSVFQVRGVDAAGQSCPAANFARASRAATDDGFRLLQPDPIGLHVNDRAVVISAARLAVPSAEKINSKKRR